MNRLTEKQAAFWDAYRKTGDAAEAARLAGYRAKGPAAFRKIGERILQQPAGHLPDADPPAACLKKEPVPQSPPDDTVDEQEILALYRSVIRRTCKDTSLVMESREEAFYEPDEEGVMRKRSLKTRTPKLVETPPRLSDAMRAAESLGKLQGMFQQENDPAISGPVTITIVDEDGKADPYEAP